MMTQSNWYKYPFVTPKIGAWVVLAIGQYKPYKFCIAQYVKDSAFFSDATQEYFVIGAPEENYPKNSVPDMQKQYPQKYETIFWSAFAPPDFLTPVSRDDEDTIVYAGNCDWIGSVYSKVDRNDFDINERDELGRTALMYATQYRDSWIALGADVNAEDYYGCTPLDFSILHCNDTEALVDAGAHRGPRSSEAAPGRYWYQSGLSLQAYEKRLIDKYHLYPDEEED